ncbi:hypothetical protein JYU34_012708 [Plutella xylostella]|uniref:Uncharacterized protein n=1 Tax=Plutella xylostella TaxID=51655 RepID=A0ABQ7PSX8_PLUXY|nr:hypothetical protein JYU34_022877 [Plutella xylostella]KAG7302747.1 hypothetical protein JYU34_012708 [Plutella xylostella]
MVLRTLNILRAAAAHLPDDTSESVWLAFHKRTSPARLRPRTHIVFEGNSDAGATRRLWTYKPRSS